MVLHARVSWMANISAEMPDLCPNIEEVDTRIIPHAMHAVKSGTQRIVALSGDTDVFILLMHYWSILHSEGLKELWIRAGVGIQQDTFQFT